MKQMVINAMPEEMRMAIIADGILQDIAIERGNAEHVVNRIYKAQVRNVLSGMQAAFVDIGRGQNAYLNLRQGKQTKGIGKLTEGQSILVQVVKEEMGKKGARVTADISLAGRYMVLLPYSEGLRISKKVGDEAIRIRLKEMAAPYLARGGGFILRTAAAFATEAEVAADMAYLWQTWEQIQNRFKVAKAGTELYRDADFWFRLVRDYLTPDIDAIIVDDKQVFDHLQDLLKLGPHKDRLQLYDKQEGIFKHYGVEEALDGLAQAEVPLPAGGTLRIDRTEALTVIDVNSAHFIGRTTDMGDTALLVNQEAAVEICRQLRLRDIGGIIVVDFIDMPKEEHRAALYKTLYEQVKLDRVRVVIGEISALGLLEMTRKRERQGLQDLLFDECSCCGGTGYLLSAYTIYLQLLRRLRELQKNRQLRGNLLVEVHPEVKQYFTKDVVTKLSEELHRTITIGVSESSNREAYSILSVD